MPGAQRHTQAGAARQAAMTARDSTVAQCTLQITGHAMLPVLQIYQLFIAPDRNILIPILPGRKI